LGVWDTHFVIAPAERIGRLEIGFRPAGVGVAEGAEMAEAVGEVAEMRRMDSMRTRRLSTIGTAVVTVVAWWLALPGMASAASFLSDVAFDPATLGPVDVVIDSTVDLFDANDLNAPGNTDVQIDGSLDLCILVGASTTCASANSTDDASPFIGDIGPITFLVTLTVAKINNPAITGPFTLVMRDLIGGLGYTRDAVTVDNTYAEITGLDPNGFDFDETNGINGFDPFLVVQDNVEPGDIRYYLGWEVNEGDSVTFRFDLKAGQTVQEFFPGFTYSAIPVPEPGTALLMGLGLVGLTLAGRRAAGRAV
jgi:hypothetical protein